jgi:hypothetical protein
LIQCTVKSMSEALIFASTNPQYDKRLSMKIASSEHQENMLCTQIVFVLTFRTFYVHNMFSWCSELAIFMNNLLSYCGLVDGRISASEKDLPVLDLRNLQEQVKKLFCFKIYQILCLQPRISKVFLDHYNYFFSQ